MTCHITQSVPITFTVLCKHAVFCFLTVFLDSCQWIRQFPFRACPGKRSHGFDSANAASVIRTISFSWLNSLGLNRYGKSAFSLPRKLCFKAILGYIRWGQLFPLCSPKLSPEHKKSHQPLKMSAKTSAFVHNIRQKKLV